MTTDAAKRAAQFLNDMGHNNDAITVRAHSAPSPKGRVGRKFLNALKMTLPFLVVTASVHSQAPNTPLVAFNIDNSSVVNLSAVDMSNQVQQAFEDESLTNNEAVQLVTECFKEKVVNIDLSPAEKSFAAMVIYAQAPKLVEEIERWTKTNDMPKEIGLAAYCENPFDWKGQVESWKKAARRVESAITEGNAQKKNHPQLDPVSSDSMSDTISNDSINTLYSVYGSNALELHATQRASQYQAILHVAMIQAQQQQQQQAMGEATQLSSGFDWVNAGIAITRGAAALAGGPDAERQAAQAGRHVQSGANVVRQVDRASNRSGASRWEGIGQAAQSAGRIIHDSAILDSTPSSTPRIRQRQ